MKKPSISDIKTLYDGLNKTVFSAMHANMEECHKMYNLDFEADIEVPDGFVAYIPPTGYWIVQTGASQLITDSPTVDVEAISDTEKAQKSADIMREFGEFLLQQMEIQNEASPLKECASNFCALGMAVLKGPLFDSKAWQILERADGESESDYKERVKATNIERRSNFPIYFRAIDPRTFYPDPSGRKLFAFECYNRLAIDIHNNWPEWKGYKEETPFQEVPWLEAWWKDWRSYLANEEPILRGEVIYARYGS